MANPKKRGTSKSAGAKGAAPGPGGSTPNKESLVDKGLKIRWEESLSRYRAARSDEMAGWDERYEALGEILDSDPPYYLAGGYKTAKAFLAAEVRDQEERTVRAYIRVARYFDPEDEARYGITKLGALLDHLEAVGGAPLAPAKIHPEKTKLRIERAGKQTLIPFSEATKDEIRLATRVARAKSGKRSRSESALVALLRKALGKAALGRVSVRQRGDVVDFGGVPKGQIQALGKVLVAIRTPTHQ